MESTFETRLNATQEQAELLASQARQLAVAERRIFTQLYVAQADRNFVKSWGIATLGITARQYNSIAYDLKGRVKASAEHARLHLELLSGQIKALKQKIAKLEQKLSVLPLDQAAKRRHIQFVLHQKKRRLSQLQARSPSLHTTLMEARTRSAEKHVWSGWSVVKKRLGRDRREWPGRCPEKGVGGGREAIVGKAGMLPGDRTPRAGESPAASRESCSPGAVEK
jgi:hypothetical protein